MLFSKSDKNFFDIAESCFEDTKNLKQAKNNYTNNKKNGVSQQPKHANEILTIISNAGIK
jgi:hypothetical protein